MTPVDREEKFLAAAVGDISSSELPSPVTRKEEYLNRLVDKVEDIEEEVKDLEKLKNWLGETTTPITVNSTTNPITISGVSVMAAAGDVTAYDNGTTKDEFIFSEAGTWQVYDDKLDVYTKDETDELLDEKMPNTGNTKTGSMYISREFITTEGTLENNVKGKRVVIRAYDESGEGDGELIISAGNGLFDAGIEVDESGAITVLAGGVYDEEHDTVTAQDGQLYAMSGKTWHLVKEGESKSANTEIARKGDLTEKLDKTGGTVTGALKTSKSTFTDNDEFVPKSYVDTHGITDYTQLTNKPSINNVTLTGNKTLSDLGISEHDNYVQTVLWQNTGTTNPATITLNDSYKNYDEMIMITSGLSQGSAICSELEVNDAILCTNSYSPYFTTLTYVVADNTTLTFSSLLPSGATVYVEKIIGIAYGARKPYKETMLYQNPDTTALIPETITLSQPYDDFDALFILGVDTENNNYQKSAIYSTSVLGTAKAMEVSINDSNKYIWLNITDSTTLTRGYTQGNITISKVIGISYGGSVKGRNVISLYHGTSLANSITLDHDYTNYDEIIIVSNTGVQVNSVTYNVDDVSVNNLIGIWTNAGYIAYTVTSGTVLTLSGSANIDYIADIYGIKYDSDYITIDTEMSATSENPVQNKVVKAYVDAQIAAITDYESEVFPNA